jgi:hypothetical protein
MNFSEPDSPRVSASARIIVLFVSGIESARIFEKFQSELNLSGVISEDASLKQPLKHHCQNLYIALLVPGLIP